MKVSRGRLFFAVRSDCAFSCRPGQATSSRAAATNQPARTTQTTTTLTHDTLTYLLPSSSFCPPSPVLHLPSVSCPAGRDLLVPARVYKPLHLPIVSRLQHIHGLEPRDGRWVAETIDQSKKSTAQKVDDNANQNMSTMVRNFKQSNNDCAP